jgi:hypothetical protein
LSFAALLKASLHHTTAVLVRADFNAVLDASIENELSEFFIFFTSFTVWLFGILRGLENAQKGLDDMVTMSTLFNVTVNF